MTSISTDFTATGNSPDQLTIFSGQEATYEVSGTFVATLVLYKTVNNWLTSEVVTTITTTQSTTYLRDPGTYRWSCTEFTSGTATAAIADVADIIPGALTNPTVNSGGQTVLGVTDTGLITQAITATAISGTTVTGTGQGYFDSLKVNDSDDSHTVTLVPGNESANRNLSIPVLGGNKTLALIDLAQTFSAVQTFTPQAVFTGGLTSAAAIVSTVTTGTAPFTVASTTQVANLNAASLGGATFAAPGAIGSGTPSTGAFTTLTVSNTTSAASSLSGSAAGAGTLLGNNTSIFIADGQDTSSSISPGIRPKDSTTIAGFRFQANNTTDARLDAATFDSSGNASAGKQLSLNLSGGLIELGGPTQHDFDATFADGKNIVTNTANGSKIATSTSQKLGFWNATPIVQPAGAAQAAPAAYATGVFGLDSDANMHALYDLVVAIRTALVNSGIMKGAA